MPADSKLHAAGIRARARCSRLSILSSWRERRNPLKPRVCQKTGGPTPRYSKAESSYATLPKDECLRARHSGAASLKRPGGSG